MAKKSKLNIFLATAFLTAVFGIFVPQNSLAWFDDQETAETNALSASILEFSAKTSNDEPAEGIAPTAEYTHRLNLEKTAGSLDFNYRITLENFNDGGSGLCDNLTIRDDIQGLDAVPLTSYSPLLSSYSVGASVNFTVVLTSKDSGLMNKTCTFDYNIAAWQTDMPDASTGFSDQKIVSDSILSDPWEIEPVQGGGQGGGENYEEGEGTAGNEENDGDIEDGENDGSDEENDEEFGDQEQQIEQEEEIKIEEPEEAIIPAEDEGENGSGGNEGDESGNNDTGNDTGGETAGGSETE